ncbi:NADPH-dependent oxidoreductase [Haloarcula sp. CBA1130]|uniref:NADPH-dependent FMN reductase n=1 Tax=unclassified Haloarcula TaxID=2624677 RepID=UPI001245002C|nr:MULTISPECIES: NAD(P)H-dependent oxidoreductase [unclassified Haloarcula]KAA9399362.1 NADPH-dependent oxidoreductase [Haloarcula sp. CBA1129]KAA9403876.1 NADPH-dependent oxidoreductase [Haloarcula sp. CBA1130]
MHNTPHVIGISGSLRDDSGTRVAVQRALSVAADDGVTTEHIDLREWDLPLFDPDTDEAQSGDGPELAARVSEADAMVLGTPVYHGTIASPLKTALDYCSIDDVEGTTVGILAVAGGGFPTPALEHLRASVLELKGWPLPRAVAIPDSWAAFEDGSIADEDIAERVEKLGADVVAYAGVAARPTDTEQLELTTSD